MKAKILIAWVLMTPWILLFLFISFQVKVFLPLKHETIIIQEPRFSTIRFGIAFAQKNKVYTIRCNDDYHANLCVNNNSFYSLKNQDQISELTEIELNIATHPFLKNYPRYDNSIITRFTFKNAAGEKIQVINPQTEIDRMLRLRSDANRQMKLELFGFISLCYIFMALVIRFPQIIFGKTVNTKN